MMGMMGPGWGLLTMVFWIAVIGLLIYGVLLIVSKTFEKKEDPSLKILKERYARGEIDHEEYERMKNTLSKS
jgi:putative membrane protein